MRIKKVKLTNVKCYSSAEFIFENGINFISGVNGAGKTSIIESIGFALFDYKIGKSGFNNYFIKRGEKKAEVIVIFEDKFECEYMVQRKVSYGANNSWIIKDVLNEEEIVSGEIDVSNWLKDHLGFYRDDNISEIYENIISVPQGMFTSAFLDTAKSRKSKFDPIFNLEIYRTIFENTASFESGIKNKVTLSIAEKGKLDVKINMLKNDEREYNQLNKDVEMMKKTMEDKAKEYERIERIYNEKIGIKNEIIKIQEDIRIDKINSENINKNIHTFNEDLKIANEAVEILRSNKELYEIYIKEEQIQKELKQKKKTFDVLNESKNNLEMSLNGCNKIIEIKTNDKEEIKNGIRDIENNIDQIREKVKIESDELKDRAIKLEEEKINIIEVQKKVDIIEDLRKIIDKNQAFAAGYIESLQSFESIILKEEELFLEKKNIENLISKKEEVEINKVKDEERLNKLIAKLETINESKKIVTNGICPYLKTDCINVKGKSIEEYNREIEELEIEISDVKQDKTRWQKEEKVIIEAEANYRNLILKIKEIDVVKQKKDELQKKLVENERERKEAEEKVYKILEMYGIERSFEKISDFRNFVQGKQEEFNKHDKEYDVFKTKLEQLKKEIENKMKELEKNKNSVIKIEEDIKEENNKIKYYSEKIKEIYQDLKQYDKIEEQIEENEKNLANTKSAYDIFVQKMEIANKADEIKKKIDNALKEVEKIREKLREENLKIESLSENYNEEEFKNLEKNKSDVCEVLTKINTRLETNHARLKILVEKVLELNNAKRELEIIDKKITTYEKAKEYLVKIRQIIKQAPEEISKILIQKVNDKGAEIYSKIANDNTRLEWREGYEIILTETIDGKNIEKEFRQLSGGEQMSAALAIRIAMLEILTNLKIGILDEPTVNMDVGRRQRLAEIIESIGTLFIQLFVVSHDDTFNSITENMIQL